MIIINSNILIDWLCKYGFEVRTSIGHFAQIKAIVLKLWLFDVSMLDRRRSNSTAEKRGNLLPLRCISGRLTGYIDAEANDA